MRIRQVILTLEDLCNHYTGTPLRRVGRELTARDRKTVESAYIQWMLILTDLGYLPLESYRSSASRLYKSIIQRDVLDLVDTMNSCAQLVRNRSVRGFKALCHSIGESFYSLVKRDVHRMSAGDVLAAKRLLQVFSYLGRLTLLDIDLTDQCENAYLDIEDNLSEPNRHLVDRLRPIIQRWTKGLDLSDPDFRHGPGGVAGHGRCTLETKYRDLTSDILIEYVFGDYLGEKFSPITSHMDRTSHTIFVPKSYKTFRTISMEPTTLQFLQQGVWRAIDDHVNSIRYLRDRIGFHDQTRNQVLARTGSFDRSFATIDLSAASDSVSYSLVKQLFRGTPLYRALVATRSRRTLLPSGKVVDLKKFAPMGSALCFPIETLIFAAVCEYVTRVNGSRGQFSVFGDDIIVPTSSYEDTVRFLTGLGFSVNSEKSYYDPDCWFRESCGGEYFNGIEATPLRISRRFLHDSNVKHAPGYLSMANECYARGYVHLRSYYLSLANNTGFSCVFSESQVQSDNPTNYQSRRRWNDSLHRTEVLASIFLSKSKPGDDTIRYHHWMRETRKRDKVLMHFSPSIGYVSVNHRKRFQSDNSNLLNLQLMSELLG